MGEGVGDCGVCIGKLRAQGHRLREIGLQPCKPIRTLRSAEISSMPFERSGELILSSGQLLKRAGVESAARAESREWRRISSSSRLSDISDSRAITRPKIFQFRSSDAFMRASTFSNRSQ